MTRDGDFYTRAGGHLNLNPILYQELSDKAGASTPDVRVFSALSKALSNYGTAESKRVREELARQDLMAIARRERKIANAAQAKAKQDAALKKIGFAVGGTLLLAALAGGSSSGQEEDL